MIHSNYLSLLQPKRERLHKSQKRDEIILMKFLPLSSWKYILFERLIPTIVMEMNVEP